MGIKDKVYYFLIDSRREFDVTFEMSILSISRYERRLPVDLLWQPFDDHVLYIINMNYLAVFADITICLYYVGAGLQHFATV